MTPLPLFIARWQWVSQRGMFGYSENPIASIVPFSNLPFLNGIDQMTDANHEITRRSVLKQAAVTGAGLVMSGSALGAQGSDDPIEKVERVKAKDEWFSQRAYCLSGNKVLSKSDSSSLVAATYASQVYLPRSAQEIAEVVKSLPVATPIACVCGGHETSNAAMVASREAVGVD